jgi:NAD(P)-dependent dehydrogenase (short-subunit alcohol dehydrogenase family)
MSHLKGQSAVITGGSSGIGLAIARSLAAEGMAVTIGARDLHRLETAAKELEKIGGRALAVRADVGVSAQAGDLIKQAVAAFGRVDVLVNNAGIGTWGMIEELSEADWDRVQSVNLKGAFLCTKAVLPVMKRQGGGYIINVSSLSGKEGSAGGSAYSASKFGMIGLTQSLIEEGIPHNIRATAVCPGYVATPMVADAGVPASEMIPPEDIGKLVVNLLHLSPVTVIREIVVERKGAIGKG